MRCHENMEKNSDFTPERKPYMKQNWPHIAGIALTYKEGDKVMTKDGREGTVLGSKWEHELVLYRNNEKPEKGYFIVTLDFGDHTEKHIRDDLIGPICNQQILRMYMPKKKNCFCPRCKSGMIFVAFFDEEKINYVIEAIENGKVRLGIDEKHFPRIRWDCARCHHRGPILPS